MDDFDYIGWAHRGPRCDNPQMVIEFGERASLDLGHWNVKCENCGKSRTMQSWSSHRWSCTKRKPWLDRNARDPECDQEMVAKQTGNVAVSFNEIYSIMLIPPQAGWVLAEHRMFEDLRTMDPQYRDEVWEEKFTLPRHENFRNDLSALLAPTAWRDILEDEGVRDKLWADLKNCWRHEQDEPLTAETVKRKEQFGLKHIEDASRFDPERFSGTSVIGGEGRVLPEAWQNEEWPINQLVRVDRLTELRVMPGLRRKDPAGELQHIDDPLSRGGEARAFGIAGYNKGEGIYLEIKPQWLQGHADARWNGMSPAQASLQLARSRLHDGYHRINPWLSGESRSTVPHTVLHTFSHLLIKEFALISGFSLAQSVSVCTSTWTNTVFNLLESCSTHLAHLQMELLVGWFSKGPPLNGWNRRSQAPSNDAWNAPTTLFALNTSRWVKKKTVLRAMHACSSQKHHVNSQTVCWIGNGSDAMDVTILHSLMARTGAVTPAARPLHEGWKELFGGALEQSP